MDRLTAMRVFVEAVDRGSISAAADAMQMSRTMASRYLEGLEQWLGTRLLHRTTRRLSLTQEGEHLVHACRDMLALESDVAAQAGRSADAVADPASVRGHVRLTSTPSFAAAQLAAAIADFRLLHPGVQVDMVVSDRTMDLVLDRIDLAIRLSNRIAPVLVARRLAVCHSVLCAAPGYLLRAGEPVSPQELRTHQCLVHSTGFAPRYRLHRAGVVTEVDVQGSVTANETTVLHAAALAGAGIAMLPTFLAGPDLAAGRLRRVLADYALPLLDIQAVYLSRRHQPLALRLLIDFLAQRFGGPVAPWDRVYVP